MMSPRGRYAPSPTGLLHLGNARTALISWLSIRSRGGTYVWRLEDLDPPRTVEGAAEAAIEDIRWLGMDWDEGTDVGGPYAPYAQSERYELYEDALQRLFESERLFPCSLSRKDLREIASAPHGDKGRPPYPAHCRPDDLERDWFARYCAAENPDAALRFIVHDRPIEFTDRVQGPITERVDQTVGDFVLKRRDGLYAYQLAVVIDDVLMQIDEVVRGTELLSSTARQIQLMEALGYEPPEFAHVPMVLNAEGDKLSKRDEALSLRALREAGVRPEQIVGYMAWSLDLIPDLTACKAEDLIDTFDWDTIAGQEDWQIPEDLPEELKAIS